MTRTRKSLWASGPIWTQDLLWYARAVGVMQARPITDRTSWRFLGAIHAWNEGAWIRAGFFQPGERLPPEADRRRFWSQCQHGSWYFLPWHRGYLAAFEQIALAAVTALGGPRDWALPYWNYSDPQDPNALDLHPAFASPRLPSGERNPLYAPYRPGSAAAQNGRLRLGAQNVVLDALQVSSFFGAARRNLFGFGGGRSAVAHFNNQKGALESVPHDLLHMQIGAGRGDRVGLMSDPSTAGLDPIFWLHHANIDRLWEVWLRRDPRHENPQDPLWLGGPLNQPFAAPGPDGGEWRFSCADVVDTRAPRLDYVYDDVSDPLRARTMVVAMAEKASGALEASDDGQRSAEAMETELVGTNGAELRLGASAVTTEVVFSERSLAHLQEKAFRSLEAAAPEESFFLILEGVKGENNVGVYQVEVDFGGSGEGAEAVGQFATFGLTEASSPEEGHGQGMTFNFDITEAVQRLALEEKPDLSRLKVSIVAETADPEIAPPTVERVNVYRVLP